MKTIKIKNSNKEYSIGKIVCVARNYAEHAKELGNEIPDNPVLFIKPSSSVIYSGGEILYPSFSNNMHHEVELVLLIGNTIKDADEYTSKNAIEAYSVGLDMTLRDVQGELKKKGSPWTVAKCFDTSCVLTDFISASDYNLSLDEVISLSVNDTRRQYEKLNLMLFPPVQLVQYISSLMTLEEGDLVFTGTPAGVGPVKPGDKISASISNIADLECTVK